METLTLERLDAIVEKVKSLDPSIRPVWCPLLGDVYLVWGDPTRLRGAPWRIRWRVRVENWWFRLCWRLRLLRPSK